MMLKIVRHGDGTHHKVIVPDVESCRFRGSRLERAPCQCLSNVHDVQVYSCSVHERCTLATPVSGAAVCSDCEDREHA